MSDPGSVTVEPVPTVLSSLTVTDILLVEGAAYLPFAIFFSGTPNLTATGSTQGDALSLPSGFCMFTTVASGTGAVLPADAPVGSLWEVWNAGANDLLVYPFSGAQIQGFGTDLPATISTGGAAKFFVNSLTQVYAR